MSSNPPLCRPEKKSLILTAQKYAEEIVQGLVTPYEGGRRIWRECQLGLGSGDHRLDPFVYWASEHEETTSKSRIETCNKAILLAAVSLLQNGSAL